MQLFIRNHAILLLSAKCLVLIPSEVKNRSNAESSEDEDDKKEEEEELGFDIMADVPDDDSALGDELMFEFSEDPPVPTYSLSFAEDKGWDYLLFINYANHP